MVFRKTDAGIYSSQLAAGIDFPAMFWISYSTHRTAKRFGPWLDHSPPLKSDLSPFPGVNQKTDRQFPILWKRHLIRWESRQSGSDEETGNVCCRGREYTQPKGPHPWNREGKEVRGANVHTKDL